MFFFAFQLEYVMQSEPMEPIDLNEAKASYNPDMYKPTRRYKKDLSLGARIFCKKHPINVDCLASEE